MTPTLPVQAIAADVCVAPQLTPEAMTEAARLGFKSVVNNRPDFEGGPDQAAQMAQLLQELPRPVLMFCRSGARSARLYALAQQA